MKNQAKNAKTTQSGKCCNQGKEKTNCRNAQNQNKNAQDPESCK